VKALEHRLARWFVLAIALALGLSSLKLGFYNDDYLLIAGVKGYWPHGPPVWDLYRFSYGSERGNLEAIADSGLMWWSAPAFKLHLVRPLASLSFVLDLKLFGDASSVGWHLHSIAWYLALVYLVGCVLRAVMPRATATANLAMLIYAVSSAHFFSYAWIAGRHLAIAATFGMIGLLVLLRGRRHGHWIFAGCLAASLAGGEAGVGIAVFGVVYMLTHGKRAELAPTAIVLCVWLGCYVAVGGGAGHSDGYVDPTSAPGRFAVKAATMLPVMIGNATFAVPAEMAAMMSPAPLAVLGLVAAAFVFAMWRGTNLAMTDDERSPLPWLVVAGLIAIVPSLGGFPGARILLIPNVGFAALIAVLVRRGFAKVKGGSTVGRIARAGGAGLLCFVHVIAAPLVNVGNGSFTAKTARQLEALSATVDVSDAPSTGVRFFVLGASDPTVTMYPPTLQLATSAKHRELARCWSIVSGAKTAHEMKRVAPNVLVVRPTSGHMLDGPFEAIWRSTSDPLHVGDESRQCNVVYRVTAMEGVLPSEIQLTFDVPLEDPSVRFLRWNGERFERLVVPSVGETATIAWSPGPLGMF